MGTLQRSSVESVPEIGYHAMVFAVPLSAESEARALAQGAASESERSLGSET